MKVSEIDGPVVTDADSEALLPPHNDQYGKLLGRTAIDTGEKAYQIAVVFDDRYGNGLQLDMRSIWWRNRQPRYGKGFRINIKGGHAEDMLASASYLIDQIKAALTDAAEESDNGGT